MLRALLLVTVAGAVGIAPAGSAKPASAPRSPVFRYLGAHPASNAHIGAFVESPNPDGTAWAAETQARGTVRLWVSDFGGQWQIDVDGKAVGPVHVSTAAKPPYVVTVPLAGTRAHDVELRMAGRVYFGGATGTLSKPAAAIGKRIVFLGDSYIEGTGAQASFTSLAIRAADRLGLRDVWDDGSGGTGYTTGGATKGRLPFGARVGEVAAAHPDVVVIAGGLNDQTASPDAVTAAASSVYARLKARLPHAKLIVVGPWPTSGSPSAALLATRDAVKAAATGAGLPFVDPIADGWINSSNASRYIGPDHVHPNQAGHDYLGARLAAALRPLFG